MNLGKDLPEILRLWAPPLLGVLVMIVLARWFEVAWYFLFTHHLFWIIGVILLIDPVFKTFSSSTPQKDKVSPKAGRR